MIFEITEREEWTSILRTVDKYDFYHTFDYHRLSCANNEKPILFVYLNERTTIAIPLIISPISDTGMFDARSVYGYAGPVSTGITEGFDSGNFARELEDCLRCKGIISVFSRLNPYIESQSTILSDLGGPDVVGKVVSIDLSLETYQQRSRYSSRLKTQLNQARREIRTREGTEEGDILSFWEIYTQSMDRLNAGKEYYFSKDYFLDFLGSDQIDAILLLAECKLTGELMAGSMFVCTGDMVQYHLGGTLTDYLDRMPSKLLIDEMRLRCDGSSRTHFNLGGGLGGNSDGLFRFKRSFSPSVRLFSIWKFIVDKKAYNELLGNTVPAGEVTERPFPAYRH